MALAEAANVELEPIWAALLTKALEGRNVKDLLLNIGSGGGGPAPAVAAGGTAGAGPAAEPEKVEEKEEEKEESDDDMVRSLSSTCDDFRLTGCSFRVSVSSINLLEPCRCTCSSRVQMYLHPPSLALHVSDRYCRLLSKHCVSECAALVAHSPWTFDTRRRLSMVVGDL